LRVGGAPGRRALRSRASNAARQPTGAEHLTHIASKSPCLENNVEETSCNAGLSAHFPPPRSSSHSGRWHKASSAPRRKRERSRRAVMSFRSLDDRPGAERILCDSRRQPRVRHRLLQVARSRYTGGQGAFPGRPRGHRSQGLPALRGTPKQPDGMCADRLSRVPRVSLGHAAMPRASRGALCPAASRAWPYCNGQRRFAKRPLVHLPPS
jgi:hypothetical protein